MPSRAGKLDMVGMTRAHLADPHIVRKVMDGRENEIRRGVVAPPIASTASTKAARRFRIHNAATGREATIPHVIRKAAGPAKRVVVVGAGAAGLEGCPCRRRARSHGDGAGSTGQAGGQVRLAAQNQRRRELIGIVDWRLSELERLGVDIRYDILAEAGPCPGAFARRGDRCDRRHAAESRRWRRAMISSRRVGPSSPAQ